MRKLVLLTCTVVVFAGFSHAQQIAQTDVAVGGSTLFSSKSSSSSEAFLPPALKGGVYPSFSVEVLLKNHYGINAEGMFRYHQGLYDDFQRFRPIFYDVNGVYARGITAKANIHVLAGFGGESLIFYNTFGNCPSGACRASVSGTHFVLHAGAELPYYIWRQRHIFVRPEAHYYRIIDNTEFNSANLLRLGASIGYTFGR